MAPTRLDRSILPWQPSAQSLRENRTNLMKAVLPHRAKLEKVSRPSDLQEIPCAIVHAGARFPVPAKESLFRIPCRRDAHQAANSRRPIPERAKQSCGKIREGSLVPPEERQPFVTPWGPNFSSRASARFLAPPKSSKFPTDLGISKCRRLQAARVTSEKPA